MKRIYTGVSLVFFLAFAFSISAQEWACIQHDAQHTGRTSRVAPSGNGVICKWEALTTGSVLGSPVVMTSNAATWSEKDIIAVTTSNDKHVRSFYANGTSRWDYPTSGSVWGSPAFASDGQLLAACGEGYAYELNWADGSLNWAFRNTQSTDAERRFLADVAPMPGGGILAADWMQKLYVVDNGTSSVAHDLGVYTAGAPTLSSDGSKAYYIVGSGGTVRVRCIDTATGSQDWQTNHSPGIGGWGPMQVSAICLDETNDRLYFSSDHIVAGEHSALYALAASTGSVQPNFPVDLETGSYAIPALSPDGSVIYVTLLNGHVRAYDTTTAAQLWDYDSDAETIRGSAVVDGEGKVLFGDMKGVIHCLDADGNPVWQYTEDDSTISGSLAIMDNGNVVYGTMNGKLKCLGPAPLEIPHSPKAPAIDGVLNPADWADALVLRLEATTPQTNPGWNPLNGDVVTIEDCSAWVYVMHDGSNLYVAFDVTDDDVCYDYQDANPGAGSHVWNDDCTEVFIDGDFDQDATEGGWQSAVGDRSWNEGMQPHFGVWKDSYWDRDRDQLGVEWWAATSHTLSGYVTEYRFPLSTIDSADGESTTSILQPGEIFGFNVLVNDDDGGGDREDQVALAGGDISNNLFNSQHDWHPAMLMPQTAPPDAPSLPDLEAKDDTGLYDDDNITSLSTDLTISGSAEAGATVTLYEDGSNILAEMLASDGSWMTDIDLPGEGIYSITAVATSASNGDSSPSQALMITIDQTAPSGIASVPDLAASDDSGQSDTDNITNRTFGLSLSGSAPSGSLVYIKEGGAVIGSTTANVNVYSTGISLSEGVHDVYAVVADLAGNESAPSESLRITVDTTAPAPPSGLDLGALSDSGRSPFDNITNKTTMLSILGNMEADTTLRLYDDGAFLKEAYSPLPGFALTVDLAEGIHPIRGTVTDLAGNVSELSSILTVVVDTTPPATPAAPDLLAEDDSGYRNNDNITNRATSLTLRCTSEPNAEITIWDATDTALFTSITLSGTYETDLALSTGTTHLSITAVDVAGNISEKSPALTIIVDQTLPQITVNAMAVSDRTPQLSGTYFDNIGAHSISVLINGKTYTGVLSGGTWTADVSDPLPTGTHDAQARITDIAGNNAQDATTDEVTISGETAADEIWMLY
ncbi:MAG: Ig-like domain-containing protein [bacterium]